MAETEGATATDSDADAAPRLIAKERRFVPALNLGASWANQLIAAAGSFVVTPALLSGLGDSSYGVWLLINSFIVYMRFLDVGISSGTMKYSAGALARSDRPGLSKIFSTSVLLFGVAGLVASLVTALFVVVLPTAYPAVLAREHAVILVLGLATASDLLFRPLGASLRSRSLYFIPDSVETATYLVFKFGLVLYFASRGLSLWVLALLTLGETLVRNFVVSCVGLWLCDWTRHPSPRSVDRALLKTLALYGAGSLLINIGELFRFGVDAAVIGYFLHDAQLIAVYGIGLRLVSIAYSTISAVAAMSIPKFSALYETEDREGFIAHLAKTNLLVGLVSTYLLVNIGALGLPFLRMWIDTPWVGRAFQVTLIMLPAYFIELSSGPGGALLAGAGKLRGVATLTLVEAAINLALSVALLHWFGIYGVAFGTAIPMILVRGLVFPWLLRRTLGIPIAQYLRTHARALVAFVAYAVLVLPSLLLPIKGPLSFILAGLLNSAVFALLVLAVHPGARHKVRARLGRR